MRRLALLALLLGCSGASKGSSPAAEPNPEPAPPADQLRRELEGAALESLGQLTLGNLEAYADGMRLDRPVVLLGTREGETYVGAPEGSSRIDRRPLPDLYPQLLSKNLEVQVSETGAVGWVFDEVSYRVAVDGRFASIPIRTTSVYIRDVDRWVLAMDHWSYAQPIGEIRERATAGELEVSDLPNHRAASDRIADAVISLIGRLENGDRRVLELRRSRGPGALLLLPGLHDELHGANIAAAPTLYQLFGGDGTVGIRDYRIEASPTGEVAWVAANLVVRVRGETRAEIVLRATYVLVHGQSGWQVVQQHVSAPVEKGYFGDLLFGEPGELASD